MSFNFYICFICSLFLFPLVLLSIVPIEAVETKYIIAMVGLPGSGKSYVALKLGRYLKWVGYSVKVLSLAKIRHSFPGNEGPPSAEYYDPASEKNDILRMEVVKRGLDSAIQFLNHHGNAIIIGFALFLFFAFLLCFFIMLLLFSRWYTCITKKSRFDHISSRRGR